MKTIKLSVHDFVDILLRKGDIDNRIFNTLSMNEGSRLHAWYQAQQNESYQPEFYLTHVFRYGDFELSMDGRADGIIVHDSDNVTIDEIKTTNTDIEAFYGSQKDWHLGQALVYAYIYLTDHSLESIKVQLTYISQLDTTKIKQYLFIYQKAELEEYVDSLLHRYCHYLEVITEMKDARQKSIESLRFPFKNIRKGQQDMMDFAYQTIQTNQIGFCQAQTGIGKTISALFPYIKKLGEYNLEKIFYLTSKSSIKKVAYDTLDTLNKNGGRIKGVVLTAKRKLCPNTLKGHCNPDECPFAVGYYDKVLPVMMLALRKQDLYDDQSILDVASANNICPFEFQLDMANYADVIIGDYNYLFDPSAKLVRFFDNYSRKPYLLLVDEAHNLPSRVRDMFSAEITISMLKAAKKDLGKDKQKFASSVKADIKKIEDFFDEQKDEGFSSAYEYINELKEIPDTLIDILNGFIVHAKKYMRKAKHLEDSFLDLYYTSNNVLNLPSGSKEYAYYFTLDSAKKAISFSISCLDPRSLIKDAYNAFTGGLLFSATFSPEDYFIDLCGGDKDSLRLDIPSPFDPSNRMIIVDPFISTKYRDRETSVGKIIAVIMSVTSQKKGNYFVFFPSYDYMMKFKPFFMSIKTIDTYFQQKDMDDYSRREFLGHFKTSPIRTTIGFTVLGGVFSEGIDLTSDRLIGAIVVSVGLPKMSFIEDKLADYFGNKDKSLGYNYAYSYPGINRVIQGAGRVIRGEDDRGIIVYIDSRYSYSMYKQILKNVYDSYIIEGDSRKISDYVKSFWEKKDE